MAAFSTDQLKQFATGFANQFGIDPNVFLAQIEQESSWNPNAVNGNAYGIAQFMPGTAAQFGLTDRSDPIASLRAAAQYDAQLLSDSGGDYLAMLERYGTLSGDSTSKVGPGSQVFGNFAHILEITGNNIPPTSDFGATGTTISPHGSDSSILGQFKSWVADKGFILLAIIVGLLLVAGGVYGLATKG